MSDIREIAWGWQRRAIAWQQRAEAAEHSASTRTVEEFKRLLEEAEVRSAQWQYDAERLNRELRRAEHELDVLRTKLASSEAYELYWRTKAGAWLEGGVLPPMPLKQACAVEGCDYASWRIDYLAEHQAGEHQRCACGRAFGTGQGFTVHLRYTGHQAEEAV